MPARALALYRLALRLARQFRVPLGFPAAMTPTASLPSYWRSKKGQPSEWPRPAPRAVPCGGTDGGLPFAASRR
jgi:hypothetical protein